MKFLADESCDFAAVRALRAEGHDVVAICELAPESSDEVVMAMAVREKRVLLTEDKDFGQLVFSEGQSTSGVVLLRFPAALRNNFATAIVETVQRLGTGLYGSFVVVRPGGLRIRRAFDVPH